MSGKREAGSGKRVRIGIVLSAAFAATLASATSAAAQQAPAAALRDAYKGIFRMGAALNDNQVSGRDALGAAVVQKHYNTISPENVLKWEVVHPRPNVYDFGPGDRYVAFGQANGMFIIGHTLVWHSQTPAWVFQDSTGKPLTRDALLQRLHDHIATVVGHYKGRINGWDVVNEAINDGDGTLRKSPWYNIIGEDFIAKAFQYAHEADPAAELYYNDYSLEDAPKRNAAVALIRRLKAQGIPIAAVGVQGHDRMDWPTLAQEDSTITALAATGVKVNITEFDIDVLPRTTRTQTADVATRAAFEARANPFANGLPDSVQTALAKRYADLFSVFLAHRKDMDRITFWGVGDGDSWLNNWPVRGRTSYPLLFDRQHQPKPAFDAVLRAARTANAQP